MQADMRVTHLAFKLGTRHQGSDAVDDDHIDGTGAHQGVADFQRLLSPVRLAEQQVVDIDPELAGIDRVQRVLGVDERAGSAPALGLGDRVQRERRLSGTLGPVNLENAPAGQTTDAEREIQPERAGRDHLDTLVTGLGSHTHDRAFAERTLDLRQCCIQRLVLLHVRSPFPGLDRAMPL